MAARIHSMIGRLPDALAWLLPCSKGERADIRKINGTRLSQTV
jgi:hypothetical protein